MNGSPTTAIVHLPHSSGHADLKPAPIYDVTKLSDESIQTLNQLLKKGHIMCELDAWDSSKGYKPFVLSPHLLTHNY